jgi:hypothetical protein
MPQQHGPRRWLLGALVILVAALVVLDSGHEASAESAQAPLPDYGSKEAFKRECERLGGTYGEAGDAGSGGTYCLVEGWAWIECDANGNNCTLYTAGQQPGGGANSPDGTGDQNAPDDGGTGFPGLPGDPPPDTLPNLPGATG